nr:hypothetical protein [Curtobacterium flaccumfaciens]
MGASAMAQNVQQLWILQAFTGLGIGAMFPSIRAITAEYASARWRSAAVVLQTTGYPIGAALGGVIAGVLLERWRVHWRGISVRRGVFAAMHARWCWRVCPSRWISWSASARPTRFGPAQRDVAAHAAAAITGLPALPPRVPFHAGLCRAVRRCDAPTFAITRTGVLLAHVRILFRLSWTPKLLIAAGMSAQRGDLAGPCSTWAVSSVAVCSVGWRCAGPCVGRLAGMFCWGAGDAGFSAYSTHLASAFAIALVIGAAVFAAMSGFTRPHRWYSMRRSAAPAWAGRSASVASARSCRRRRWVAAGRRLVAPAPLYLLCTVPLLLAAVALLALRTR